VGAKEEGLGEEGEEVYCVLWMETETKAAAECSVQHLHKTFERQ
jgi:hypothetical protein